MRADNEAGVRRARLTLEDALRCASLPDSGARVLLVRRLDLGTFAADASSQSLSRLLERRVAEAAITWVHGSERDAVDSSFVSFHDALEARCVLASRLAHAAPCTAWYWPLAVREYNAIAGAAANLRNIALTIAAWPEAAAALPAWFAHLTEAGVAVAIAQAISTSEGESLLRAAHLVHTARGLRSSEAPASSSALNASRAEKRRGFQEAQPAVESCFAALPAWIRTLALAGGHVPAHEVTAPLLSLAQTQPSGRVAETPAVSNQTDRRQSGPAPAAADAVPRITGQGDIAIDRPASNAGGRTAQNHPVAQHAASVWSEPRAPALATPFAQAAPSICGGLLFLLPVLQRLDYQTWTQTLPEGMAVQLTRRLLALVLQRLHAPADDPAWLLAETTAEAAVAGIRSCAPAAWAEPTLAAPRGAAANNIVTWAQQSRSVTQLAYVWLIACRRWLRRIAGIGVASLVLRPARVALTATHADVYFRLGDTDLRVRRAGLDIDPGWLPWLGCVVSFHYQEPSR